MNEQIIYQFEKRLLLETTTYDVDNDSMCALLCLSGAAGVLVNWGEKHERV